MNVEIFTCCEAATNKDGSFCILQTFNDLFTREEPVLVGLCIVVQVSFSRAEEGSHVFHVILLDNDGNRMWQSSPLVAHTRFDNPRIETSSLKSIIQGAVGLMAGDYELRLLVDDVERLSIPLGITLIN